MKRYLRLIGLSGMLLLQGCYYYGPAGAYYDAYYPSVGVSYYGSYGYWPYSYYSYRPYYYSYPYRSYRHYYDWRTRRHWNWDGGHDRWGKGQWDGTRRWDGAKRWDGAGGSFRKDGGLRSRPHSSPRSGGGGRGRR